MKKHLYTFPKMIFWKTLFSPRFALNPLKTNENASAGPRRPSASEALLVLCRLLHNA